MAEDPLFLAGLPEPDDPGIQGDVKSKSQKEKTEVSKLNAETKRKQEERLQKESTGLKTRAPPAPPAPPPAPPPPDNRSKLIDRIMAYKQRFPHLQSRNKITMKASEEELQDELHYFENQLGGGAQSALGMNIFLAGLAGVEKCASDVWNPLGLNLAGMTQVARDNPTQFEPLVDELMLKYGSNRPMGPELRLVFAIGTLMYTVHAANTGDERVKAALEKMGQAI